jgi:hypothetical protein
MQRRPLTSLLLANSSPDGHLGPRSPSKGLFTLRKNEENFQEDDWTLQAVGISPDSVRRNAQQVIEALDAEVTGEPRELLRL